MFAVGLVATNMLGAGCIGTRPQSPGGDVDAGAGDTGVVAGDVAVVAGDAAVVVGDADGHLEGGWELSPVVPIVSSGDLNSLIDYAAASDPHVLLKNGIYYLYYTCVGLLDANAQEIRNRLCLATSNDGINFTRHPANPILDVGPPGAWDSLGLETPFVLDGNPITLFYNAADTSDPAGWLAGTGITLGSIGMATSSDGIHFQRAGPDPVLAPSAGQGPCRCGAWDSWTVEGPWVLNHSGRLWMWYGGAGSIDGGATDINGIGLAFSYDGGATWTKHGSEPQIVGDVGAWDEFHLIDPTVTIRNGTFYLWYHGADATQGDWYRDFGLGAATSADGLVWTKSANNPVLIRGPVGSWTSYAVMAPSILTDTTGDVLYFHGLDGYPNWSAWAIGRAVPTGG